jgi:hypothetical protein
MQFAQPRVRWALAWALGVAVPCWINVCAISIVFAVLVIGWTAAPFALTLAAPGRPFSSLF